MKKILLIYKFVLFLLLLTYEQNNAQSKMYHFDHLSLETGISHNLTHCILQDHYGFMWFGTLFGLIKYDGQQYTVYRNDPQDSTSISHDDILTLFEDNHGFLWVGTRGKGLNHYNPVTNKFQTFLHDPDNPKSISSNTIFSICQDSSGNLWIGTQFGLNKLERQFITPGDDGHMGDVVFIRYLNNLKNDSSINDNIVNTLIVDDYGTLWVGTQNGLGKFETGKNKFKRYFHFNPRFTKVYPPEFFRTVTTFQNNHQEIAAIEKTGHYSDASVDFNILHPTYVLVHGMGEGRSEFRGQPAGLLSDYGWLENLDNRQTIWKMEFEKTLYCGGAEKNRNQSAILRLPPGHYRIRYKSDDSHSFTEWNSYPPDYPQLWGIQVFSVSPQQIDVLKSLLVQTVQLELNSLSHNIITSLTTCDDPDLLWIGTAGGGLNRFNIKEETFSHLQHDPNSAMSLPDNHIVTLYRNDSCKLWIGTPSGLCIYDSKKETIQNIKYDPSNPRGLSSNHVYAICNDQSGLMWFGTYWGGIDKLSPYKQIFDLITPKGGPETKRSEKNILCVYSSDHPEDIWIGSVGGLMRYNLNSRKFEPPFKNTELNQLISAKFIRSILKDHRGDFWFGIYNEGIIRYNPEKNILRQYQYDSKNPTSLSSNNILSIYEDHLNQIWIGTLGGGLNLLSSNEKHFSRFRHNESDSMSISSDDVFVIEEDSSGTLWIGTSNGLCRLIRESDEFIHYQYDKSNHNSLSNNYVYTICQPKIKLDSTLWIGTASGLNQFDLRSEKFIRLGEANGLPNRVVCAILEDENGMLWLSTNRGLSQFDPITRIFMNYDLSDGLQSNMFNIGAMHKLTTGELLFGGINGVNIFNPGKIIKNKHQSPVYITDFKVFNKSHNLFGAFREQNSIVLSYNDNFFTFEFASLDYHKPERIQYAYKLEGIDENWVHSSNINTASYTNIDPGNYCFRVRATNSDGIWNLKGTSMHITIKPPFWQTWWFRSTIILFIFLIIGWVILLIIKREKNKTMLNKKIAEIKMQSLRAQMNPHFIFNTLNSIQYFIVKNDQKAAFHYLSQFSKLLRKTLDNAEKANISIAEEIENLKLYLDLQQLRFDGLFTYSLNFNKNLDIDNIDIPTMMLQPYIENAIHHGLVKQKKKGKLNIGLEQQGRTLVCVIEDNGVGIRKSQQVKQNKPQDHIPKGMNLTEERLKILNAEYSETINISIVDLKQLDPNKSGTRVTLRIPIN